MRPCDTKERGMLRREGKHEWVDEGSSILVAYTSSMGHEVKRRAFFCQRCASRVYLGDTAEITSLPEIGCLDNEQTDDRRWVNVF